MILIEFAPMVGVHAVLVKTEHFVLDSVVLDAFKVIRPLTSWLFILNLIKGTEIIAFFLHNPHKIFNADNLAFLQNFVQILGPYPENIVHIRVMQPEMAARRYAKNDLYEVPMTHIRVLIRLILIEPDRLRFNE